MRIREQVSEGDLAEVSPGVLGVGAELLLDTEQLVVLGQTLGPGVGDCWPGQDRIEAKLEEGCTSVRPPATCRELPS